MKRRIKTIYNLESLLNILGFGACKVPWHWDLRVTGVVPWLKFKLNSLFKEYLEGYSESMFDWWFSGCLHYSMEVCIKDTDFLRIRMRYSP